MLTDEGMMRFSGKKIYTARKFETRKRKSKYDEKQSEGDLQMRERFLDEKKNGNGINSRK